MWDIGGDDTGGGDNDGSRCDGDVSPPILYATRPTNIAAIWVYQWTRPNFPGRPYPFVPTRASELSMVRSLFDGERY